MIYDTSAVALLSTLATERRDSTNAHIARYLLEHAADAAGLSVRGLSAACNVGAGSVSRFCREVGFESFDDLRAALARSSRSYERVEDAGEFSQRATALVERIARAELTAVRSVDEASVAALVADLRAYERVSAFGLLKAQSAATCLQVDLLMQGKYVDSCVSYAEQLDRIAHAGRDELVVVFSYTGDYFSGRDLSSALARLDRPRIWMVCGVGKRAFRPPSFVAGCVAFRSEHAQLGHPYQLEAVASLIAQEFAR